MVTDYKKKKKVFAKVGQPEWGKLLPYPDMLDTYDQNVVPFHL